MNIKNKDGKTVLDCCLENINKRSPDEKYFVQYLRSKGAVAEIEVFPEEWEPKP